MKVRLELDYTLSEGWFGPWIEGLRRGRAVGATCSSCGEVSFPPERICPCGRPSDGWTTLAGTADIVLRTSGADGDFALARFDGAATHAVVRLEHLPEGARRGQLVSTDEKPAMAIGPTKEDR